MKKVSSAAYLALSLTWKTALVLFLLCAGVQTFAVYRWLMPDGVPLQAAFGFETMLSSAVHPHGLTFGAVLMVFLIFSAASTRGSRSVYTMNRLRLSESQMALVFGGVFTGYFLLYWAFQLALAYGFFVWYSRFALVSSNTFMLACWRSEWLHILLPLNEWWGYLRNLVLCISLGYSAAFGSQLLRRGKLPLMSLVPLPLCVLGLNGEIASGVDWVLTILLALFTVGYFFAARPGSDPDAPFSPLPSDPLPATLARHTTGPSLIVKGDADEEV